MNRWVRNLFLSKHTYGFLFDIPAAGCWSYRGWLRFTGGGSTHEVPLKAGSAQLGRFLGYLDVLFFPYLSMSASFWGITWSNKLIKQLTSDLTICTIFSSCSLWKQLSMAVASCSLPLCFLRSLGGPLWGHLMALEARGLSIALWTSLRSAGSWTKHPIWISGTVGN